MFSIGEVREMASVFDVAAYVLEKQGPMTAMKLQKLVYYSQAWSLVWDETPLFGEKIKAWANGPVVPQLYHEHKGQFQVTDLTAGDPERLTPDQKDTIDRVLNFYGHRSSQWLSDLTHAESPWQEAREKLAPGERGDKEISHAAMAEYYGSL
jgi:uncharacterized phage-associated protein